MSSNLACFDKSDPEFLKPSVLLLEDGRQFLGYSFGYEDGADGEVVFNTGMVAYPESLTDPSYQGQILVLTFPLVGNYGVPSRDVDSYGIPLSFEGDRIHVNGLVVADYSYHTSHWRSAGTLASWLKSQRIPGITGIDTRAVTKHVRMKGTMLGKIIYGVSQVPTNTIPAMIWEDPNTRNLVAEVSTKQIKTYKSQPQYEGTPRKYSMDSADEMRTLKVMLVDCGMKYNILRYLLYKVFVNLSVTVVPWDHPFGDAEFDGLIVSNGPGNPELCDVCINNLRKVMQRGKPILGICLGNQLLAVAAGASTYKMKFGNRGMNQPVVDMRTSKCYITAQNHGYAVDSATLPKDWLELFVNANDRSNEGIIHRKNPWFSAQFHPEAAGGPTDTAFLFDDFIHTMALPTATPVSVVPIHFPLLQNRVLVLGSGGLTIGQAGEFDYSGSQAIKALKEMNVYVILINPNIATVQTSSGLADRVYFLPVTPDFVEKVIIKERPDGLLCTFGGQTALNCAVELNEKGVLRRYKCTVLGTPIQSIIETENRGLFVKRLAEIDERCAPSFTATDMLEAKTVAKEIGYPVLVRSAYALGGLGSGFAEDEDALVDLCKKAFTHSPQITIDMSLKGWKEIEYEVVRDWRDNCVTICNMENFDPLGIHTGDSIVVAPSQTLSNQQYYALRETAIKVIRHFGIIGESNIQYAVDPNSDEYYIVEVNARLSRSSALASKATGYPLAYVAAKLALGFDLVQIPNSATRVTTACFEPSLDYVVTKVPRWDLKKFGNVDQTMGSAMKSVGEVMAIGRTFEESIQKALRMVEEISLGFDTTGLDIPKDINFALEHPSPARIWVIAKAFEMGYTVEEVNRLTRIDRWFLYKLYHIECLRRKLSHMRALDLDATFLRHLKIYGFSDEQIGQQMRMKTSRVAIYHLRERFRIFPYVKQIDTLAGEFPAYTNYLYLTYQACETDLTPLNITNDLSERRNESVDTLGYDIDRNSSGILPWSGEMGTSNYKEDFQREVHIVLGCGCYRIGSSVEFDWSCMSCVKTLRTIGHRVIIINCNPETVSTDFDESDRLYFEDLSIETILDIWNFESPEGVIISVGGQSPNNLASELQDAGVRILGTSVESIDTCEDRNKFSRLCDSLSIDQPAWSIFTSLDKAVSFCQTVKYPVLVRPSYVLSGAAMRVVANNEQLESFLKVAAVVSRDNPVVITKYIFNTKEVEMDSVARDGLILNYAITEHVENAGVHSGDATLILPAQKLYVETIRRVKKVSQKLAKALRISGPFNIQFLCSQNEVKIIECNLRASRTFPFISKTFNVNLIDQATRVMVNAPVRPVPIHLMDIDFVGVKAPIFSFGRLRGSDPMLGVEMRSTGEVACFGGDKHEALLKSIVASGFKIPSQGILISIGPLAAKVELESAILDMYTMGFVVYATEGTYEFIASWPERSSAAYAMKNFEASEKAPPPQLKRAYKQNSAHSPSVIELINSGLVDLVVNIPDSLNSTSSTEGYRMRRCAIDAGVPLITDVKLTLLVIDSLTRKKQKEAAGQTFWEIKGWDEYVCLA